MKTVVVLMLLAGCDCDGVVCRDVRTVSSGWSSVEACRAAIGKQIASERASYPLVTARCTVKTPGSAPLLLSQYGDPASPAAIPPLDVSPPAGPARPSGTREHVVAFLDSSVASVRATVASAGGIAAGELLSWLRLPL